MQPQLTFINLYQACSDLLEASAIQTLAVANILNSEAERIRLLVNSKTTTMDYLKQENKLKETLSQLISIDEHIVSKLRLVEILLDQNSEE